MDKYKSHDEALRIIDNVRKQTSRNAIIHHSKNTIYVLLESASYISALLIILAAIRLPMEIVYFWMGQNSPDVSTSSEYKDLQLIASGLRMLILSIALFPVIVAFMLRKLRHKNNLIKNVYDMVKE